MKADYQTHQMEEWGGAFGKDYTDRNSLTTEEIENLYSVNYGITRTEMNREFVGDMDRDISILEVGSNIGIQLELLQSMGFTRLYGIELQAYAVELSKKRTKNINIIQGSALDIPFKDGFFDMVFTSGVLIHISPKNIDTAIDEIYRCAGRYIWGFEYFDQSYTEITYRGNNNLLWKANYPELIMERHPDLTMKKNVKYPYSTGSNTDIMYLLKKR